MDHPDIIAYISNFLDSKSLSMLSNTNHMIYDISNNVYKNRSLYAHVSSMVTIKNLIYYSPHKPIKLKDQYDGYKKITHMFPTFTSETIKIIFYTTYIQISSINLLTSEMIQVLNITFDIQLDVKLDCVDVFKSNLDVNSTIQLLRDCCTCSYYGSVYFCTLNKQLINTSNIDTFNITFVIENQTLAIHTSTLEQTYYTCKKLFM